MQELMASGNPAYSFTLIDSAGNSRPLNLVDGIATAPAEEGEYKLYASYTEYGTTYYSNGVSFTVKKPEPYWFYFGDTQTLVLKMGSDVPAGYGSTVTGSGKIPDKIKQSLSGASGWEAYRSKMVKAVVADAITAPEDMSYWFNHAENLASLEGFEKLDVSSVTSMSGMFLDCSSLDDISGLTEWDTHNVMSMEDIFLRCSSLEDISALTKWDTHNVTSMDSTFAACTALEDVSALADWNTGNVTNMDAMFSGCSNVTNWTALNEWDVTNVITSTGTFYKCRKPLPSWANVSFW